MYPPVGDQKNAVGAAATQRAVTKRLQVFEAARPVLESILDSGMAISPNARVTGTQKAMIRVTGVPREDLIVTPISDYFIDPERAASIYHSAFERGMAVNYPLTLRHRDGTRTEVLYDATAYGDAGGNVPGVFAAAEHVTNGFANG